MRPLRTRRNRNPRLRGGPAELRVQQLAGQFRACGEGSNVSRDGASRSPAQTNAKHLLNFSL